MNNTLTLSVMLKSFGNYQKLKGSSLTTVKKYYGDLTRLFRLAWKTQQRQTLTAPEIQQLVYAQHWQESTKSTYLFELRSFLHFCELQKIKVESPKNFLYRKPIKKEAQRLTTGEIHKILQYVAKNRKNQAMILLLLTTGLRLSELCSLQKQQFKKAILIGNVYQINVLGKGKKLRSIFLPITTRNCCTSLKSKGSSVLGMKKATVQYRISRIRNATHIKFSAHTLRHTYLSYLASQGADVYKIQKIAGHASLTTTSLYLHCSNKELADTAGLVCNLME